MDVVIPLDLKSAAQAAKLGQPLAKATGAAKVTQPMGQLVSMTIAAVDGSADGSEAGAGDSSLLGKLNLKTLLTKKPKDA